MKNRIYLLTLIAATSLFVTSCKEIDEEPPRNEGTFDKTYKITDPKPLTVDQRSTVNEAVNEYNEAIKNVE